MCAFYKRAGRFGHYAHIQGFVCYRVSAKAINDTSIRICNIYQDVNCPRGFRCDHYRCVSDMPSSKQKILKTELLSDKADHGAFAHILLVTLLSLIVITCLVVFVYHGRYLWQDNKE